MHNPDFKVVEFDLFRSIGDTDRFARPSNIGALRGSSRQRRWSRDMAKILGLDDMRLETRAEVGRY